MTALRAILLALLLVSCSSNNNGPSAPQFCTPGVGQWCTYGPSPQVNNGSFSFPNNTTYAAGYFYTQLPAVPKPGQTLTLNYTVVGNNPVWQQAANGSGNGGTDINPPTIHLFLWRRDDNLQCNIVSGVNYAQYRMFGGRTNLILGANQTISILLDPSVWTGCYGGPSTTAQWSDLLNNLLGVGFTFGGQYFAGHGIYLSSGSATFIINSFSVQ